VWAPRPWSRISADTGVGDPQASSPEKGALFLDAVATRIASFLIDLDATDPATLYD
jgi:creatinine amidohydrolase